MKLKHIVFLPSRYICLLYPFIHHPLYFTVKLSFSNTDQRLSRELNMHEKSNLRFCLFQYGLRICNSFFVDGLHKVDCGGVQDMETESCTTLHVRYFIAVVRNTYGNYRLHMR